MNTLKVREMLEADSSLIESTSTMNAPPLVEGVKAAHRFKNQSAIDLCKLLVDSGETSTISMVFVALLGKCDNYGDVLVVEFCFNKARTLIGEDVLRSDGN